MEMTTELQNIRDEIPSDGEFDEEALMAAETKLMQIMMDLSNNTVNVNTLTENVT